MKYIYGPLVSRRLGNSLGITTIPYKICNFDCIYCQLKETRVKQSKRKRYAEVKDILKELQSFFDNKPPDLAVDHITISGSGEPTLNVGLERLIEGIKLISAAPVVLITNSSTMVDSKVRGEMFGADIVVPSLDAVSQDVFEKIDRPASGVDIFKIIDGLIKFRKEFSGSIWLEIMLVHGLNDSDEYLKKIKEVVDKIQPDRVQINSPVRPPALSWVKPVSKQVLKKAKTIFGQNCDIV